MKQSLINRKEDNGANLDDEENWNFDIERIKEDKLKMKGLKEKYCIPLSNTYSIINSFKEEKLIQRKIPIFKANINKRSLECSGNISHENLISSIYFRDKMRSSDLTLKDCLMTENIQINQQTIIQKPILPSELFHIESKQDYKNTPEFKCIQLDEGKKEIINELQNNMNKIQANHLIIHKSKMIDAERISQVRNKLKKFV